MKWFDYPESVVEADTSVIFCLDPELIITYCNPAWDRFAMLNGGPKLCRPATIGHCVLNFIGGPDQGYFEKRYRSIFRESEPWEHEYECSSREVYRKFRLRALPMKTVRGLFVINSLVVERAHNLAVNPPLEEVYRKADGVIVMCASCRRTRRNGPGLAIWDWVPNFLQTMPPDISHGMCAPCKELYYPEL